MADFEEMLLRPSVTREDVFEFADDFGELFYERPRSRSEHTHFAWRGPNGVELSYIEDSFLGVRALLTAGEGFDELAAAVSEHGLVLADAEVFEQFDTASEPTAQLRALNAMVRWASNRDEDDRVVVRLRASLTDANESVRYAGIMGASYLRWEAVDQLASEFAEDSELGPGFSRIAEARADEAAGEYEDYATNNTGTLLDRAELHLESEQFERAERSASEAIELDRYDDLAWFYRARARRALDKPWLGLCDAVMALDRGESYDREDLEFRRELLEQLVSDCRVQGGPAPAEVLDELYPLLYSFVPAAGRIVQYLVELDAGLGDVLEVLAYETGNIPSEDDFGSWAATLYEKHPDSAFAANYMARAAGRTLAAVPFLEAIVTRLTSDEVDPFDQAISPAMHQLFRELKLCSAFEEYHRLYRELGEEEKALEIAQRWADADGKDYSVWLHLGVNETVLENHEAAIAAYDRAIAEHLAAPDKYVHFGEHPIATAYFNRACERAFLGARDDQVFDDLEHAAALVERFADDARVDDYLEGVWSDERFEAALRRGVLAEV